MRRRTKGFDYGEGNYYFTIKGGRNNITMHRKSKAAAVEVYQRYESVGKDIVWLGKWDGDNFVESSLR